MWGLVALICLDVLWLFSLAYWRNHFYNLFIVTHVTCFSVLLPGVRLSSLLFFSWQLDTYSCIDLLQLWFHKPRLIPYALATLSFFALDYLLRLVKTRVVTATIRPLSELDVTRIEVPNINAGWRAGQHVRVRILSTGMGWFGWSEMHPFTIASVGVSDSLGESVNGNGRKTRGVGGEEGMVLMCKKTGRWTNRLFEIAKMSGYVDGWMGREVKVWIEGPYGEFFDCSWLSLFLFVLMVRFFFVRWTWTYQLFKLLGSSYRCCWKWYHIRIECCQGFGRKGYQRDEQTESYRIDLRGSRS